MKNCEEKLEKISSFLKYRIVVVECKKNGGPSVSVSGITSGGE
jgi:hypothetical protein